MQMLMQRLERIHKHTFYLEVDSMIILKEVAKYYSTSLVNIVML